jgi:hypothetical protein
MEAAINAALAPMGYRLAGPLHYVRQHKSWIRRKLDDLVVWAGSKSFFLSNAVIGEYFGGVAFSAPANVYLALCTTTPTDASTGSTIVETDYASYARTQIGTGNNQTDAWNAPTGSTTATVTNKNAITAPTATGASTNPLLAVAVCTAATVGNMMVWGTITSTAIANGDTPKLNPTTGLSVVED